MKNNLVHILGSFGCHIDPDLLNDTIEKFNLRGESCFFLFELQTNKCCYFCPSIIHVLGYDRRKYLDKGYFFFKSIIHPLDFSALIDESLTLILSLESRVEPVLCVNFSGTGIRAKTAHGNWTALRVYLVYLNGSEGQSNRIIIGFIEVDNRIHDFFENQGITITSREKEVIRYLAEGCSAKMIADYLGISETTVITHRKNLIQKLHARNSAELIKKGFELNILV